MGSLRSLGPEEFHKLGHVCGRSRHAALLCGIFNQRPITPPPKKNIFFFRLYTPVGPTPPTLFQTLKPQILKLKPLKPMTPKGSDPKSRGPLSLNRKGPWGAGIGYRRSRRGSRLPRLGLGDFCFQV